MPNSEYQQILEGQASGSTRGSSPASNAQLQLLLQDAILACTDFTKLIQSGQQAYFSCLIWRPTQQPDYPEGSKVDSRCGLSVC
ncbi:hypothetical protein H920_07474 [Fukomys damarensis]|uniref:Uncharacterized protein n=1 Tax=Fukomys damarensis TaxID=885580 RepID=A0A091DFW1_FUKDA|nr:hypothetical protein H920_07474 [Fukomys damarensis]